MRSSSLTRAFGLDWTCPSISLSDLDRESGAATTLAAVSSASPLTLLFVRVQLRQQEFDC